MTEQTEYDLDEQIRTCILRLEGQWSAKNLLFDLDMPKLPYRNNLEMMDHVWMNLIGNAVKFSYEGGAIHIRAKKDDSHITVWVRDEGIGIRPEHISHIFDKFYQKDTAHASAGNGLGLSLVHRILELCGGEIQAESPEGQGTTFCIRLPGSEVKWSAAYAADRGCRKSLAEFAVNTANKVQMVLCQGVYLTQNTS